MECTSSHWFLLLQVIILSSSIIPSSNADEIQTLLTFKQSLSLSNDAALSTWNQSNTPLCSGNTSNWRGLQCQNNVFYGLQLENMGLKGLIDVAALTELPNLRSVSFMNNSFDGPFPEVKKLGGLIRGLFLSNNLFSGEIAADAFNGMVSLRRLYLANNGFTGRIPSSAAGLPKLADFWINDNQIEGEIPEFSSNQLRSVNFTNNRLVGPVPASLQKLGASSFSGNSGLCGLPLAPCKPPTNNKKSLPKKIIIIIIAAAVVVALAAIFLFALVLRRPKNPKSLSGSSSTKHSLHKNYSARTQNPQMKKEIIDDSQDHHHVVVQTYKKAAEHGELQFLRNDGGERFELHDLLKSSAEVLGNGSLGTCYKAVLGSSGRGMVVKRFLQMSNVGVREFQEHMRLIGRLSHPNLLPVVAFYHKEDEKLLVADFVVNGSLASHLHGKRAPNQPGLDWPTRLKIIKGVARGLAYLYQQLPKLALPHGHLKSSNVLLDETFEPLLTDYALVPITNKDHAQQFMVAYKSPEFTDRGRTTNKTDVWALGILILEMVTGKFPANYLKQGQGSNSDLAAWVNSVVREEWTGEVFDKAMRGTKNGEGEMLKLLKIGMCCGEWNADKRWGLREAVEKIEGLKERDTDDEFSSYASDGDLYSSRAMTDEEFSFSVNG